jgi:hypothetical protein
MLLSRIYEQCTVRWRSTVIMIACCIRLHTLKFLYFLPNSMSILTPSPAHNTKSMVSRNLYTVKHRPFAMQRPQQYRSGVFCGPRGDRCYATSAKHILAYSVTSDNSRNCVFCGPCYSSLLGNTIILDKRRRFLWGSSWGYMTRVCL